MTTATVQISAKSWEESRYDEPGGDAAFAQADYTMVYSGDLEGEGSGRYLLAYTAGDVAKPETLECEYQGYERVTGTLAGRTGSFVFETRGVHKGAARTSLRVVPDSGTGDLIGLRGEGSYVAETMEFTLTLEYELG